MALKMSRKETRASFGSDRSDFTAASPLSYNIAATRLMFDYTPLDESLTEQGPASSGTRARLRLAAIGDPPGSYSRCGELPTNRRAYPGIRKAPSILRASAFRAALQDSADKSVAKMIDSVWTLDRWNWLSATINT
jgi:hypothetical protein